MFVGPSVDEAVEFVVAFVSGSEAFGEDLVDLLLEGVEEADGWGGGGVVLFAAFGELEEVEVVPAVRSGRGAFEGGFRDGLMDGKGVYTYANGRVREGIWSAGKLMDE